MTNVNAAPDDEFFKPVGHVGRPDAADADERQPPAGGDVSVQHSSRKGTVMIRATVEHVGLAGDTEMTVIVKWPASTFEGQPCAQSPLPGPAVAITPITPLNGPAAKNYGPGPLYGEKAE